MEVWFQYGDDGQKFCTDLVWAFKQVCLMKVFHQEMD